MKGERSKAPVAGAPEAGSAASRPGAAGGQNEAISKAESRLVSRVFLRCHAFILAACAPSSVPPEFLGALTAIESGGNPEAVRFEPAVYTHLQAVAGGASPRYGGIVRRELSAAVRDMLHPKSGDFHARYLTGPFGANHRDTLAGLEDEALRELATSWGFTQIMGYHTIGRGRTVRDLLDPAVHYRTALELLAEFAEEYQLDLAREFEEMFRCWNTGQPYGETYDPRYTERGLRRLGLYRALAESFASKPAPSEEAAKRL